MANKKLDSRLIPLLEEKYNQYWWPVDYPEEALQDPFKHLILALLSQNTSEVNCLRAYTGLAARFEIIPEVLVNAGQEEIKQAIRSGGLYNVKSKRIKELSSAVLEKFDGDVASVLSVQEDNARRKLMELPGIGPKTADVLLASRLGYSRVTVVDTHFDRLAKRLGLVEPNAKYHEVQKALNGFIPWERGERVAGLLWLLTKYTCRAQNPKCHECPLIDQCDFAGKTENKER